MSGLGRSANVMLTSAKVTKRTQGVLGGLSAGQYPPKSECVCV